MTATNQWSIKRLLNLIALLTTPCLCANPDKAEDYPTEARKIQYVIEKELTLQPVLNAPENAPLHTAWSVHLASLNLRDLPSFDGKITGKIRRGVSLSGVYLHVIESDEEWLEFQRDGETYYAHRIGLTRPHPKNLANIAKHGNLPIGEEVINRWWGMPIDYAPDDMVEISAEFQLAPQAPAKDRTENGRLLLREEASAALDKLLEAMLEDGLECYVNSAYRSGRTQQRIYLAATRRRANQRGTAPPGHSEHQLGTTVDFSTAQDTRKTLRSTDPQYHWLAINAGKFGWKQSYTKDNTDQTGYIIEPWHWRYHGPQQP